MNDDRSIQRSVAFVLAISLTPAIAQDQCEAVLKYAGVDEEIVSTEVNRIRKFVNDFCSSSDSVQKSYNQSSAGVDVGIKGFSLGASGDSSSGQLAQAKSAMCNNQAQAVKDFEKSHRETRRATPQAIAAWESCMNRTGLAARATVRAPSNVVVTFTYRPTSIGDTARVFRPFNAVKREQCDYVGDPNQTNAKEWSIGPAGATFVCYRDPKERMTIILTAATAFVNGISPTIEVEPHQSVIQLDPPKVSDSGTVTTRLLGPVCGQIQMPPPMMGNDNLRRTCFTGSDKRLTCVVTGSPNPGHPVFSHAVANDPTVASPPPPPPHWMQSGPFRRSYSVFDIAKSDGTSVILRPVAGTVLPPNAYGLRVELMGDSELHESLVANDAGAPFILPGPGVTSIRWRTCS